MRLRTALRATSAVCIVLLLGMFAVGVLGAIVAYLPNTERVYAPPNEATRVYSRDGQLIASFYRENRESTSLSEVPEQTRLAVLAIEDDRFYRHLGVDLRAIARAMWRNLRARELREGGSTITQQLARGLFLSRTRSLNRKIAEIALAVELERRLTKDEILERYLNQVYFGQGAYGIEMAARVYFDKQARELGLAESALLAGLIRAPSLYNPYRNPQLAKDRQRTVLRRMTDLGYITRKQAEEAVAQAIPLVDERSVGFVGMRAPYFTSTVLQYLIERYGEETVYGGGLRVYTTLDVAMQELAQRTVREGVAGARGLDVGQGALVALEPETGYIRAMVGGTDFRTSEFNRAWQAQRQAGSAFKPFIYTAAVASGWRPWRRILDAPLRFPQGDGTSWRPQNYDRRFRGWVTMRRALEQSINIPAVRTLVAIGPDTVISYARRMGIASPLVRNLSLALGASDVTPLEMASAYGTLAAMGIRAHPMVVTQVTDRFGRVLEHTRPRREVALEPETAYAMIDMLKGVITRGTGRGARIGRPVAGKTGTSDDYRNAWFIGFTPHLATAVWVGNDDNAPMRRVVGGNVPARIWAGFMRPAVRDMPPDDWTPPPGMYALYPPRPQASVRPPWFSTQDLIRLEDFLRKKRKELEDRWDDRPRERNGRGNRKRGWRSGLALLSPPLRTAC